EAARKAAEEACWCGDEEEEEEEEETGEDEDEEADRGREARVVELGDVLRTKQKEIRRKAFQAAFGHLSDKDWKYLHARWRKYAR
ncbi:MAG: hypothetical protein ACE5JG_12270, partial [Planctomycetota bacterium]